MYAVSFIYYNLISHCFPFLSFYGKFCLSPRTMEFFTVTTVDNWLFHQTYRFPYHPRVWPVVQIAVTIGNSIRSLRIFYHLEGVRVAAVHEEASPNENSKRTTIHHRLLVPRARIARGGVPQILWYIYAPPQNRSRYGDAKHILPLTADAAVLRRAPMPEWSPIRGRGLLCFLLNVYAETRGQNTPLKTILYITCGTSSTCAAPKKKTVRYLYVFWWCLCQNNYHFIFEHWQRYCISTEARFEFLVVLVLLKLSFFVHFVCYIMYDFVHVTLAI